MGEAVFYLEVQELMTVVNKSSDGGANKYSMYLKKKNEYIKETFWFSTVALNVSLYFFRKFEFFFKSITKL